MHALKSLGAVALAAAAFPLAAQMPAPNARTFVMKAGASDKFELSEAQLMTGSSNPQVQQFAQAMITDHTKSSQMVMDAAKADGMSPMPAKMNPKQMADLSKLKAARGAKRDMLYISQQKPAHQMALDLMQSYAGGGDKTHLKDAASQIAPVVQSHLDMLNGMPMQGM